ncbi:MAG TPA: histone deacetylase [Tepidisphaeraceae bacterium]|nr:histone deacetylase [Tepidisphaeraceae bacterium]
MPLTCFSSDRYTAPLPPGHVFPMSKFAESAAAVRADPRCTVIDPGLIGDGELLRVHTPAYVESIRTGAYNEVTALKLGLPWSPQLALRSRAATAGTLAAARIALADGMACNLAGGTHHAFPDRGEGFCVFNDVAVAIRALQVDDPWYHLMVVDLDAHQGNGTHFIFAGDSRVFTYSVHGGRNYPSKKVPGTMDVELPRWVEPAEYFERLEATLPGAVEGFEPDLVFYIAGADVHVDDRFGQMRLTTADVRRRDEWTIRLCRQWGIPVVVTYGGGYNTTPGMTARLHVQTVEVAAEIVAAERTAAP